jgi:hypothetical protein
MSTENSLSIVRAFEQTIADGEYAGRTFRHTTVGVNVYNSNVNVINFIRRINRIKLLCMSRDFARKSFVSHVTFPP